MFPVSTLLLLLLMAVSGLGQACTDEDNKTVRDCYVTFFKAYNLTDLPATFANFMEELTLLQNNERDCALIDSLKSCLEPVDECAKPPRLTTALGTDKILANTVHSYLSGMLVMCPEVEIVENAGCDSATEYANANKECLSAIGGRPKFECLALRSVSQCIYDKLIKIGCPRDVSGLWCRVSDEQYVSIIPQCRSSKPVCQMEAEGASATEIKEPQSTVSSSDSAE